MSARLHAWHTRTALRADMARRGLHDLMPYEDPERGWTDPLADREVREEVRAFLGKLWNATHGPADD